MWIRQREEKTSQTIIVFQVIVFFPGLHVVFTRLPLYRREDDGNIPICIRCRSLSVSATVAAMVKLGGAECMATVLQ
jgi:hypothetical protein